MGVRTLTIALDEFAPGELPPDVARVSASAKRATRLAYAPYSRFRVGAAALLDDGALVEAANLENAAYPQCLCAEATLLGALHTQYPGRGILLLAVAAQDRAGRLVQAGPCGSCRQQLLEAEVRQGRTFPICLVGGDGGVLRFPSAASLLPLGFREAVGGAATTIAAE